MAANQALQNAKDILFYGFRKTKAGKTIYASDDLEDLIDGNIYYSTQLRTWVLVDKANKRLIQQSRL